MNARNVVTVALLIVLIAYIVVGLRLAGIV